MELEVLRHEKNMLEFRLKGERHTFPNLLRNELLKDPKVEFAAYKLNHPMDSDSMLVLKTKGKTPKKALQDAVKRIDSLLSEFKRKAQKSF